MSPVPVKMKPFREELRALLNGYSKENESDTPDTVLAQYIERCLDAFDEGVRARDRFYGVNLRPGHRYKEPSLELTKSPTQWKM